MTPRLPGLVALLLALIAAPVYAEWELAASPPMGKVYVDPDAVTRDGGGVLQFWSMVDLGEPGRTITGVQYRSAKDRVEISCADDTFRLVSTEIFAEPGASGSATASHTYSNTAHQPIRPDTVMAQLATRICTPAASALTPTEHR